MFLTCMRPNKTFLTHIHPKFIRINMIKYSKWFLYVLFYFRVVFGINVTCACVISVFFLHFRHTSIFVGRFGLKIYSFWEKLRIFGEWTKFSPHFFLVKSRIYYCTLLKISHFLYQIRINSSNFERNIRFFSEMDQIFSIFFPD